MRGERSARKSCGKSAVDRLKPARSSPSSAATANIQSGFTLIQ